MMPKYPNLNIWFLQILNALERLGYRVVTSSSIVTGFGKHDTKWVLNVILNIPNVHVYAYLSWKAWESICQSVKNVNKDVQSWVKILHKKVVLDYDVAFIEEFNLNLKDICQNIEYWIKAGTVTVLNFSYSRDFVWTMHKAKEDWESSS